MNLYGFAAGDPVNFSDPFGLTSCPPLCSELDEPGYSGRTDPGIFDGVAIIAGGLVAGFKAVIGRRAAAAIGVDIGSAALGSAKSAARATLAEMGLPEAQAAAANRAVGRATTKTAIKIVKGEDGNVTVSLTRAGRNGKQVIESTISPGGEKTVVQKAYDAEGKLVDYDPKP